MELLLSAALLVSLTTQVLSSGRLLYLLLLFPRAKTLFLLRTKIVGVCCTLEMRIEEEH
jgi:hypothetical protein